MSSEINLPHHLAEAVCEMECVCFSEGVGPHPAQSNQLMSWIGNTYPELAEKYNWLPCFKEN